MAINPEINIKSNLGMVRVVFQGFDRCYICTGNNLGPITVNRVEYHCSCHMKKIDGKWTRDGFNSPYLTRKGSYGDKGSDAASKKVLAEFSRLLEELEETQPDLFWQGQYTSLQWELEQAKEKHHAAVQALAVASAELENAGRALRDHILTKK